jgi:hypothetical protein
VSRLLSLYPRAWQDRYRAELLELLAERPPTWRDRLDLAWGAIDARLHPQVQGRPATTERDARAPRTLAGSFGALVGGALWAAGGLTLHAAAFNAGTGYRESTVAVVIIAIAAIVSALAAVALAGSSPARRRSGMAMLVLSFLILLPWPIVVIGIFGTAFATCAYGIALAREQGHVLGVVLAVTSLVITSLNTQDERALLSIPLGLAWLALGAVTLIRPWPAPIRA